MPRCTDFGRDVTSILGPGDGLRIDRLKGEKGPSENIGRADLEGRAENTFVGAPY